MSSSTNTTTAEVRPFPQAKSAPEIETPQDNAPTPETASTKKKRSARSIVLPIVGLALLAGAGWYGYDYWTVGRFMVSTDDAYVHVDIGILAPKITGYVEKVPATENEHVKAGDPLVTLDDGDYRIAREQAEAQIATQNKTLKRIDAQIASARAALAAGHGAEDRRRRPRPTTHCGRRTARKSWSRPMSARRRTSTTLATAARTGKCQSRRRRSADRGRQRQYRRAAGATCRGREPAQLARARPRQGRRATCPSPSCARPMTASWAISRCKEGDLVSPASSSRALVPIGQALHRRQFQGNAARAPRCRARRSMSLSTPGWRRRSTARWLRSPRLRAPCSRCCRPKTRPAISPRSCSAFPCASTSCRRARQAASFAPASASSSTSTAAPRRRDRPRIRLLGTDSHGNGNHDQAGRRPGHRPMCSTRARSSRFIAMVFGMFMAILDIQIVSASLPEIQAGLSASADEIAWVQTAYLIAEVIMIPLSGFLGADAYRRAFCSPVRRPGSRQPARSPPRPPTWTR